MTVRARSATFFAAKRATLAVALITLVAAPARAALPVAAPAPVPFAPAIVLTPPPPELARGRATTTGLLLGGAVLGVMGLALGAAVCVDDGEICGRDDDRIIIPGLLTLFGSAVGALFGGLVGSTIPVHRPATELGFFSRGLGPHLGQLEFHAGGNYAYGDQTTGRLGSAFHLSLMGRWGRFFAIGPELGYYPQERRGWLLPGSTGQDVEPLDVKELAVGARVGVPVGPFYPYLHGSYGFSSDTIGGFAGSLGLGVAYRFARSYALGLQARRHTKAGSYSDAAPFLSATGGISVSW